MAARTQRGGRNGRHRPRAPIVATGRPHIDEVLIERMNCVGVVEPVTADDTHRAVGKAHPAAQAGDIGVGGREIGFLYSMYKKLACEHTGVLTGKGLNFDLAL